MPKIYNAASLGPAVISIIVIVISVAVAYEEKPSSGVTRAAWSRVVGVRVAPLFSVSAEVSEPRALPRGRIRNDA